MTYVYVVLVVAILTTVPTVQSDVICCVPDQFEGLVYLGYGNVFIDLHSARLRGRTPSTAYSYINGTVTLAYDYTNRQSYLRIVGTEVSPLIPTPTSQTTTIFINNFKAGIQYQLEGGKCQKSQLDQNMTRQCVLSGGSQVVYGFLAGGNTNVANYAFESGGTLPSKVTASVIRENDNGHYCPTRLYQKLRDGNECWPVRANFVPGSPASCTDNQGGIMYNFDVLDTTRGIKDPSIFKPPPPCIDVPYSTQETKRYDQLRTYLRPFGF